MRDSLLKEVNTQLIKHRKKASVNQVCLCVMQHDIQGFQFCYWASLTFLAVFFNGILAVLLASLYLSKSFLLLVFCHFSYKVLFSAITPWTFGFYHQVILCIQLLLPSSTQIPPLQAFYQISKRCPQCTENNFFFLSDIYARYNHIYNPTVTNTCPFIICVCEERGVLNIDKCRP